MTERAKTCAELGHIWQVKNARGHDYVSCARCYQCLGVDQMLLAYVQVHGGKVWP